MKILSFELGPVGTNAYLLYNEEVKKAILIDAPNGCWSKIEPILKKKNLELEALLLTHGHWDHIADTKVIRDHGAKVYMHQEDLWWVKDPMVMGYTMPPGMHIEGTDADVLVDEGKNLQFLGKRIEVRHIPGHAPGSVLFYIPEEKLAFVGDAIFRESIGRYDFPGCSFEVLKQSIKNKIYTLPEETILYPGHGPATTVGHEKRNNPFVKA